MDPSFFFIARKLLIAIVLPPVGPALLALGGLLLARRGSAWGWRTAAVGLLSLILFSIPVVPQALQRLLYAGGPFVLSDNSHAAQALVILGGGVRRNAVEYGGDTLGGLTLERTRYGARLARTTGLPVLVSGGVFSGATSEAELMARALREEFGVEVRWEERASRNTRENALRSAEILRRSGIRRIVLVTHGFDVVRARAEFEAQGIEVVPAPTSIATPVLVWPPAILPSAAAMQSSYFACYELLANFARRIGVP